MSSRFRKLNSGCWRENCDAFGFRLSAFGSRQDCNTSLGLCARRDVFILSSSWRCAVKMCVHCAGKFSGVGV